MSDEENLGPPGGRDGEGRATPGPANVEKVVTTPPITYARHDSPPRRQCSRNIVGRYASGWRDGFRRGAVDALRVAAREIPDPQAWVVLDRLAEAYELAAGDS
jgi:hypothetical protein